MSNLQNLQETLAKKQAEVAALEQELRTAQESQFTELPAKLGLDSIDAVIRALAPYASPRLKGALNKALATKAVATVRMVEEKPAAPAKAGKRKRAKITPELKEAIVKALQTGEKTAGEVAAEFGVSGATVNNIKREAGLTKKKLP
jgi:DNA invertase Pin-like site-specific DNA recombinase